MKTVADFKRELASHPDWTLQYADNEGANDPVPRTVSSLHSRHVCFAMPLRGGAITYLDYPKRRQLFFPNADTAVIDFDDDYGGRLIYRKA